MMRGIACGITVGGILCSGVGAQGPQPLQLASREPAFYAIVGTHIERAEAGSFAALRARLALRLHNATIPEALKAIENQTPLRFAYKPSNLPNGATVSLDARDITVAAALTQILLDADVDVEIAPYGQATIVARDRRADVTQINDSIVVRGTITDSSTHKPLSGAVVRIAGGTRVATSGSDGVYTITDLAPGTYKLVVRRLGYSSTTVEVRAPGVGTYTRDIALAVVPTLLNQVVTTVTGNQQLKTLGNTIATINADSLVPTTPVTSLSDVLNARAPGVQVINPGGLTGASPVVYVRGVGSLLESTQPLLYVDGVRVNNSFANRPADYATSMSGGFNDINPDEIASIEIVKGPSAATLYGTDAANGVILVTTKRGETGSTRWNMYGEGGALTVNPDFFPFNYTGWGHDGQGNITNQCTLVAVASNSCTQDSVTKFTPLRVPSLTPLGTGNRGKFGAEVSGGTQQARYFVSGDYTSEVGPLKDPVRDQRILDSLLGPLAGGGNIRHPNSASKYDGRVNLTTPIGSTGDITMSANYLSQESHIPNSYVTAYDAGGAGYRDACDGWANCNRPAGSFANLTDDKTQHVTGGTTAHWVPTPWLTARATVGVDASNDAYLTELPAAAAPVTFTPGGLVYDMRQSTTLYSVDLGTTLRWPIATSFVSSTSIGAQYHREDVASTVASATNLTVGGTTVGAGIPTGAQANNEDVVAGTYAEEQLAFDDRLFLTGAVRVDGANNFGRDFQTAVYPKGSASWLVSKEPFFPKLGWLSLWRVRGAYGESGTQPGEVLTTLQAHPATIDGTLQPGLTLSTLGNANIQPERQKELEVGSDLDLVGSRLHIEFTYYHKRNVNALYNAPLGASLGIGSVEENVGTIVNWGYEALVTTTLLAERSLTWDVSLNGSVNHNQVVSFGPNFQPIDGLFGNPSFVAGYSAPAWFAQPYTYSDANHDGIIEPNEIHVDASKYVYYGPVTPPLQWTAATQIGLFENHLRFAAQFDHRGGFVIPNIYLAIQCFQGTAAANNLRSASLASQAACVAVTQNGNSIRGMLQDASFTRLRELSVTYALPDRLAHHLNSRSFSLTLSARNVALWTHYRGGDPESAPEFVGAPGQAALYANGGGIPSTQYWLARINVGL
jgi:TonB-linked SusC/RagA family outer membrane protein